MIVIRCQLYAFLREGVRDHPAIGKCLKDVATRHRPQGGTCWIRHRRCCEHFARKRVLSLRGKVDASRWKSGHQIRCCSSDVSR